MKSREQDSFPIIKLIFTIIFMIIMIILSTRSYTILKQVTGEEYSSCGRSSFNHYSNTTEAYESFFGNKCYVPVYEYYETKRNCGTFGFSCYESSESHVERIRGEVCFYKKTGERC